MQRSPALIALSREHYHALKLARDAKQAATSGAADAVEPLAQRVVHLYQSELVAHFQIEEERILPVLTQAGEHALVQRTLEEHAALRALVAALGQPKPSADTLLRFGELMQAHVRFEERQMFEAAQAAGLDTV